MLGVIIADVLEKKPNKFAYRFRWRIPDPLRGEESRYRFVESYRNKTSHNTLKSQMSNLSTNISVGHQHSSLVRPKLWNELLFFTNNLSHMTTSFQQVEPKINQSFSPSSERKSSSNYIKIEFWCRLFVSYILNDLLKYLPRISTIIGHLEPQPIGGKVQTNRILFLVNKKFPIFKIIME